MPRQKGFFPGILLIGLLWIPSMIFGQGTRGGDIPFEMDAAQFRAGDGWTYLEIYFSMIRNTVTHVQSASGFEARLETAISIMKGDSVLAHKKDVLADPVDDLKALDTGLRLYNAYSFYLRPGDYRIRFQTTDLNTEKSGWIERTMTVSVFPDDSLLVSDIQLAVRIAPDTSKTPFCKNGYAVTPNASALYGLEVPILYYYAEVYGLSSLSSGGDSTYSLAATIQDLNGNEVKNVPVKEKIRRGASVVEVGKIHVAGLMSGAYRLRLTVEDGGVSKSAHAEKSFSVYRRADFFAKEENPAQTGASFAGEFDGMAEEELDAHFRQCEYLASPSEKKAFKKLDMKGKREFLKEFWQKRDENPMTAANESKTEYFSRINQSNQRFGTSSTEGWKSDQGRIFILYGEPDEIERFPGDMSRRYYEIWHYYKLEGGVIFVFVDVQNYGRLQLVHSTLTKEIHDENWEQWIE
jgi:GWxTD domain-containing protein